MNNKTLDYYNKNAESFMSGTVSVDFKQTQDKFLNHLNPGASILDFGCGSGRDTKYFLESGVKMLLDELENALKRGAKIRILTGNYLGIIQPSALYLIKRRLGDSSAFLYIKICLKKSLTYEPVYKIYFLPK